MILADTSIWIDFFRRGCASLTSRLLDAQILTHPVVLGELAAGNLQARRPTLAKLFTLPQARTGTFEDCMRFLEARRLHGIGLGWDDVQLLYSCHQFHLQFWTLDKRLAAAAREIGVASRI